jgi:glycosyltransferase involved in cell wall biosynthesis
VANPAAPYSRGLRVARSLSANGFDVEIAAMAAPGQPSIEHDGDIVIRRYRPSGPFRRWAGLPPPPSPSSKVLRYVARRLDRLAKAVLWPLHARAWWRTLRAELPSADLYHAFGILTVAVAIDLGVRARRSGRRGIVVYDVIDAILDSNNYQRLPGWLVDLYRRRERRWVDRVDAVVTVNDALADHCAAIWSFRERPAVLLNCQPVWTPPSVRPDLIREATGIPADRAIVLFLGRLGQQRGLDEAAEAVLRLPDAALVMVGFGPWADQLRERDRDPRFEGRHFTLPPVHPDEVPLWTASADVSIIAVPANSLNQRLSSPNKFWESLAAGTPIVVGRDLEVMRRIVEEHGLGEIADPLNPDDLARAIGRIVARPGPERAAIRDRCLDIVRTRYNWDAAVRPYVALVDRLVDGRRSTA